MMPQPPKPVVLCILDGWGIGPVYQRGELKEPDDAAAAQACCSMYP